MDCLVVKKNQSQKQPLIIVVSSKVSKKATVRNLIKRRLRSILKPYIDQGLRLKIIVLPPAAGLDFLTLKKEIERLISPLK